MIRNAWELSKNKVHGRCSAYTGLMKFHKHIHSGVGLVVHGLTPFLQDFYRGQKLGNFIVPYDISDNIIGLFYQFNLWQSSKGICEEGINHHPIHLGLHSMLTKDPVLCGDSVLGSLVCESECNYLCDLNLWSCHVQYGDLPWL